MALEGVEFGDVLLHDVGIRVLSKPVRQLGPLGR